MQLQLNTPPEDIIEILEAGDGSWSSKQYGVVDLKGCKATHTDDATDNYHGGVNGTAKDYVYSVQGNRLTGEEVISNMKKAFTHPKKDNGHHHGHHHHEGCDLADHLMLAIEAAGKDDGGETDCTDDGRPSSIAMIHVDNPDGSEFLHREINCIVDSVEDPIVLLHGEYDKWRYDNGCTPSSSS